MSLRYIRAKQVKNEILFYPEKYDNCSMIYNEIFLFLYVYFCPVAKYLN